MNINGSNNGRLCQIRLASGEGFVDDAGFDIFSLSFCFVPNVDKAATKKSALSKILAQITRISLVRPYRPNYTK